jgi:hypothetical protein
MAELSAPEPAKVGCVPGGGPRRNRFGGGLQTSLDARRNQAVQARIWYVPDHAARESERLDPRPERSLADLPCD